MKARTRITMIMLAAVAGVTTLTSCTQYEFSYIVYSNDVSVSQASVNGYTRTLPYQDKAGPYNNSVAGDPLFITAAAQGKSLTCQIFVNDELKVEKTGKSSVKCQYIWPDE